MSGEFFTSFSRRRQFSSVRKSKKRQKLFHPYSSERVSHVLDTVSNYHPVMDQDSPMEQNLLFSSIEQSISQHIDNSIQSIIDQVVNQYVDRSIIEQHVETSIQTILNQITNLPITVNQITDQATVETQTIEVSIEQSNDYQVVPDVIDASQHEYQSLDEYVESSNEEILASRYFNMIFSDDKLKEEPLEEVFEVGSVLIQKMVNINGDKCYYGIDTSCNNKAVLVYKLDRDSHLKRLDLACKLSKRLPEEIDFHNHQEIQNSIFPSNIRYEIVRKKDQDTCDYFWIEDLPQYGNLATFLENFPSGLPNEIIKNFFKQICKMVKFCHSRNIIFRRIDLSFFVFVDTNMDKIRYFGLDNFTFCPEDSRFGIDSDLILSKLVSVHYASPEIFLGDQWYSGKAADIWSLGVILYCLSCGEFPFDNSSLLNLLNSIQMDQVVIRSSIPLGAQILIKSLMQQNPNARPSIDLILNNKWLVSDDKFLNSSDKLVWKQREDQEDFGIPESNMPIYETVQNVISELPPPPPPPPPPLPRRRFPRTVPITPQSTKSHVQLPKRMRSGNESRSVSQIGNAISKTKNLFSRVKRFCNRH
jgi:hypothetical protein